MCFSHGPILSLIVRQYLLRRICFGMRPDLQSVLRERFKLIAEVTEQPKWSLYPSKENLVHVFFHLQGIASILFRKRLQKKTLTVSYRIIVGELYPSEFLSGPL